MKKPISTAGTTQVHAPAHLMAVVANKGFFRSQNGLNQLDSVRELAKILNLPNGFTFKTHGVTIKEQLSLFCKINIRMSYNTNLTIKAEQTPLIIVTGHDGTNQMSSHFNHAVVLLKLNPNNKLLVKNSLSGFEVFGKTQPKEHEVEFNSSPNQPANQWNLYFDGCLFVEIK